MLKRIVFTVTLMVLAAFALEGTNAHAEGTKIGVMNIQKVLLESAAGRKAAAVVEKKAKELDTKFKADQEALVALKEEIEKKSSAWSDEKKGEKVLELQKKQRNLQVKVEEAQIDFRQLQNKEMEPIAKMLQTVIKTYGEKNGYALILDSKMGVLFASDSIDVSDAVQKELDKRIQ